MAGHPLRSATDRRFGGPLPRQLPNQTRVHPIPPELFTPYHAVLCAYAALAVISHCYSPVWGRLPTRYSPVRHSLWPKSPLVRLACVKHAASVHPEPGSNSRWKSDSGPDNCLAIFSVLLFRFCSFWMLESSGSASLCFHKASLLLVIFLNSLFSYQGSCAALASDLYNIAVLFPFVNNFFQKISFFSYYSQPIHIWFLRKSRWGFFLLAKCTIYSGYIC